ncbi:hypothetical protein B0A63_15125 [Flavobacterium johnsoniae UW101]|nr:hypothetical protein B0A63_15125 [Flavobacterium johnsoniae UW101]
MMDIKLTNESHLHFSKKNAQAEQNMYSIIYSNLARYFAPLSYFIQYKILKWLVFSYLKLVWFY